MKHLLLSIMLTIAVFASGCVLSVHPLYEDRDMVLQPALEGTWIDEDKDTWTFRKADESGYELIHTADGESARFTAHLFRIGDLLFCDLFPEESDIEKNEFYRDHLLPLHSFGRIEINGDTLQAAALSKAWLDRMIERNDFSIPHFTLGKEATVLTGSTADLQRLVRHSTLSADAFEDTGRFQRVR